MLACLRTYKLRALYSVRAVPFLCVECASVSGDAVERVYDEVDGLFASHQRVAGRVVAEVGLVH